MLKYWSQKEISLLRKYYPKLWVKDLAKMFPNRTKATIAVKALTLDLPPAKLWQPKEIKILHKHFTESSMQELIKLLPNRSKSAILAKGERLKLKRNTKKPKIEVNEDYFKKWSPNMAYVLGFIITDGCIIKGTYKGYSDALKFGVHIKDIDVLEKIKKELKSEHKISIVNNSAAHLCITSQEIVNNLKKLKVGYRKTLREKIPPVPRKYIKDFIRGAIDGDGSIFISYNRPAMNFCGGKEIVTFIHDHLLLKTGTCSKIGRRTKAKDKNLFLFSINYKGNSVKRIISYLYNNSDLYLERKFQKAQKCLKIIIGERKDYNQKEKQIIKKFYSTAPKNEMLSMLPNRNWNGIQQKARILNLYKYNIKK